MSSHENLSPQIIQRIAKELRKLAVNPPEGIFYLRDDEFSEIHCEIKGPEGTPYENGFFRMKLCLAEGFPQSPPKGYFLTKIFHPNISAQGDICVNTLKRDWNSDMGIIHVLQVIRCLLIVPFPESSLNDEAGKLFMDSYEEYARRARIITNVHAPKVSLASKEDQVLVKETTCNDKDTNDNEQENNQTASESAATLKSVDQVHVQPTTSSSSTKRRNSSSLTNEKTLSTRQKTVKKKGLKRL